MSASRPMYETPQDLVNERRIVEVFARRWPAKVHKLKLTYSLDFVLTEGAEQRIIAWVECRKRNCARETFKTGIFISLFKMQRGLRMAESTDSGFYFLVEFTDGIFVHKCTALEKYNMVMAGLTSRNDWQDLEPCALILPHQFTRVL